MLTRIPTCNVSQIWCLSSATCKLRLLHLQKLQQKHTISPAMLPNHTRTRTVVDIFKLDMTEHKSWHFFKQNCIKLNCRLLHYKTLSASSFQVPEQCGNVTNYA